jgi:hypothetical protein
MSEQKFEVSQLMERLLKLRAEDGHAFMLRTSEATRLALEHYEAAKRRFQNEGNVADDIRMQTS